MAQDSSSPYFDVHTAGDVVVLTSVARELRQPTAAQEFGEDARRLIDASGQPKTVLDLTATQYLCSTGFAVLLNLGKHVQDAGGQLALCGLHRDVQIGANILGLSRYVPTYDDQRSALAVLRG